MQTLELFAGIGGFRVAADTSGFSTIWANDLCPKACAVYRNRFGTKELVEGDIRSRANELPAHDLLTAGFPCQPFSSAGKKKGIRDPRGTLFQSVIDVLVRSRPKYFVLENVKRLLTMEQGFHFATILSSLAELDYRIEWRLLNAMHFALPQNRQRVFIIGIRDDAEEENARWPHVRLAALSDLNSLENEETGSLRTEACWTPIEKHSSRFPAWGLARGGRFFAVNLADFALQCKPVALRSVLQEDVSEEFDFTASTLRWVPANTPVNRFVQGVEIISNQAGGARMGYTIFGIDGVAPTLTSTTSRHYERYKIGSRYRRLTNVEYARIQGFPDNHCEAVSVYDQYALLGNAVPPPMAGWVLSRLQSEGVSAKDIPPKQGQRGLFDHADQR